MRSDTDDPFSQAEGFDHIMGSYLFFDPSILIGREETMHHHVIQKVLAVILEGFPR
jgi:hypothetical protein